MGKDIVKQKMEEKGDKREKSRRGNQEKREGQEIKTKRVKEIG